MIVYKKALTMAGPRWKRRSVIITLDIPSHAKRNLSHGHRLHMRKCRASEALVVSIIGCDADNLGKKYKTACSFWNTNFIYTVGETVRPERPFCHYNIQCESGIHYFKSEADALDFYML